MMLGNNGYLYFILWLINWVIFIENIFRIVLYGVFVVVLRFFKSSGSKDVFILFWKLYCNDNIEF